MRGFLLPATFESPHAAAMERAMPAETGILVPGDYRISRKQEACTVRLRFVKRDIGNQRTARILQQQWEILEIRNGRPGGYSTEWRDVPEVDEGADASPK